MVTKMNEMFTFGGAEHISLPCCGLSSDHALRQHLAHADGPHAEQERPTFLLEFVHPRLLSSGFRGAPWLVAPSVAAYLSLVVLMAASARWNGLKVQGQQIIWQRMVRQDHLAAALSHRV